MAIEPKLKQVLSYFVSLSGVSESNSLYNTTFYWKSQNFQNYTYKLNYLAEHKLFLWCKSKLKDQKIECEYFAAKLNLISGGSIQHINATKTLHQRYTRQFQLEENFQTLLWILFIPEK